MLNALLKRYAENADRQSLAISDSTQIQTSQRFLKFAASHADVFHRHHLAGHFTGSAWLVSPDQKQVLLTHHKKLQRWLQLGGHADGEHDLANVALREATEESGLTQLRVEPEIFDLDAHEIPARGQVNTSGYEPAHIHWDVRFVVYARELAFKLNEESLALAWRPIADLACDAHTEESIARMARKWLARQS
jgi:8-oxo-dGTP pyrophosphatase MutT (NUDIX family)